jgi:GNAT superfamily N-acetyltransferase
MDSLTLRRGRAEDSYAAMTVTEQAITDYCRQWGLIAPSAATPGREELDATWKRERSLYEFLAAEADEWWVAEQAGLIVAHARSIVLDGVRELSELFVHPRIQGAGVGRGLLSRAFPEDDARHRVILSTIDPAAQTLYMGSGVYPYFPFRWFHRVPEAIESDTDLVFRPADAHASIESVDAVDAVDLEILGYRRTAMHRLLRSTRNGFLCYRGGSVTGYGYVGEESGPFAALESADLPAILAYAESLALQEGLDRFELTVPLVNTAAVDYLSSRRFRMSRMVFELMMDEPFGRFDHYLAASVFLL